MARYTGSVAMATARQVLESQESQANLSLSTDNASAQSEQAIDMALAEFQHTQNQIGLIPQLAASNAYQSPLPDASNVPRLADNYDGDVSSSHVAIHRDYYWQQFAQSLLAVDRRQTSSVNRVFSVTGPEIRFFGWFNEQDPSSFLSSNDFSAISSLHYYSPNPSLSPPPDPFQFQHWEVFSNLRNRMDYHSTLAGGAYEAPLDYAYVGYQWYLPVHNRRLYQVQITDEAINVVWARSSPLDLAFYNNKAIDAALETLGTPNVGYMEEEHDSLLPLIESNNAGDLLRMHSKVVPSLPEPEIPKFDEVVSMLSQDVATALGRVSEAVGELFRFQGSITRSEIGDRDAFEVVAGSQVREGFGMKPNQSNRQMMEDPLETRSSRPLDRSASVDCLRLTVTPGISPANSAETLMKSLARNVRGLSESELQAMRSAISHATPSTPNEVDRSAVGATALEMLDAGLSDIINSLEFLKGLATGVLYDGAWGTVTGIASLGWSATKLAVSKQLYDLYNRFGMFKEANETEYAKMIRSVAVTSSNPTVQALFRDFAVPTGLQDGFEPETTEFLIKIEPHIMAIGTTLESAWARKSPEDKWRVTGRIIGVLIFEIGTLTATGGLAMALKSGKLDKVAKFLETLELPTDVQKKILSSLEEIAKKLEDPAKGLGTREVTNSVSNLGHGYRHIDEFADGSAFSGVYDPSKKNLLAYPSSKNRNDLPREAVLKDGTITSENVVLRNGGHEEVNAILSKLNGDITPNDLNVGFTLFSTSGGGLRVEWLSRSVNGPNPTFKGNLVPKHLRSEIVRELKKIFPDKEID
jgi:hypothetical protein